MILCQSKPLHCIPLLFLNDKIILKPQLRIQPYCYSRFNHIEFKLDLIQQNAKFFLEVIHSQKSNSLEYIIIVLIAFECVLMILEMSGIGGTILQLPFDLWFTPSTPAGDPANTSTLSASAPSLELDSTTSRQ